MMALIGPSIANRNSLEWIEVVHRFSPATFKLWRELRLSGLTLIGILASAVYVSGCATVPEQSPNFPTASNTEFKLRPGDVLKVNFMYWPELNDPEQAIRPDGKISLQLVGDVDAAGQSPEELRRRLLELYEGRIIKPEIVVSVRSLDSNRVYVGGEVNAPGVVMIQGRLTALEAIMQAGGFNKKSGKKSEVVVVRLMDGKQYAKTVNIRDAIEQPESDAFELQPYDIVYVPQKAIDRVDQWVDQYVNQIIPRSVSYNLTTRLFESDDDDDDDSTDIRLPQISVQPPNLSALGAP